MRNVRHSALIAATSCKASGVLIPVAALRFAGVGASGCPPRDLERRGGGASGALRPVLMTAGRIEAFSCTSLPLLSRRTTENSFETRRGDLHHSDATLSRRKLGDGFSLDGFD